jgi:signal transduction histidine kinase
MMVNSRGQWIIGERPGDSWAHLLGGSGNTFASRYPKVWNDLQTEDRVWVSGASGAWTMRRFYLGAFDSQGAVGAPVNGEAVAVLAHVSTETLANVRRSAILQVGGAYVVALAIALWVAWTLAASAAQRRQATAEAEKRGSQLSEANKLLTQTLYNLQVMQDDLVRAERLSSLGMMVAGIAEQLSGPLGATSATLDSLKERLSLFKAALRTGDPMPFQVTVLKDQKDDRGDNVVPGRASILELLSHFQNGLNTAADNAQKAADLIAAFKQLAADRQECERRKFTMRDLLREVLSAVCEQMQKRHIVVELNCPESIELDSYPGPLAQVTENLLRNVCDHAYGVGGGPLYISVRQRQEAMVMVVEDTGRGIPEEERRHLFGPFFGKDKAARSGKSAANGMGLCLAYRFVTETLDGTMSLKSVLGLGSRFTVEVPLKAKVESWEKDALDDNQVESESPLPLTDDSHPQEWNGENA